MIQASIRPVVRLRHRPVDETTVACYFFDVLLPKLGGPLCNVAGHVDEVQEMRPFYRWACEDCGAVNRVFAWTRESAEAGERQHRERKHQADRSTA